MDRPLAVQLLIYGTYDLTRKPEPVEVNGDVRWVVSKGASDEIGMGIRFQGLRARDVWALNRFFQTIV